MSLNITAQTASRFNASDVYLTVLGSAPARDTDNPDWVSLGLSLISPGKCRGGTLNLGSAASFRIIPICYSLPKNSTL
jgi:hypothetical protein